jgi:cytochrome c2
MNAVRMMTAAALAIAAISVVGATRGNARHEAVGDPVKGKQVYLNSNPKCSLCHMIGASGGKFGPELTAIGRKRDAAWLAKYLPNPKFENPANKMPAVAAKGKDLEDLIAYLVSLKGK